MRGAFLFRFAWGLALTVLLRPFILVSADSNRLGNQIATIVFEVDYQHHIPFIDISKLFNFAITALEASLLIHLKGERFPFPGLDAER